MLRLPVFCTCVGLPPGSRWRQPAALALGLTGYAGGLALSALLDLPSGAVIVWTLALCAGVFAVILRPR